MMSMAETFFQKIHPDHTNGTFATIFFGASLNCRLLENARQAYASFIPREETPLLLYDDIPRGGGQKGFVITTSKFYYSLCPNENGYEPVGCLPLKYMQTMSITPSDIGFEIYVNDRKLGHVMLISQDEAAIIQELMAIITVQAAAATEVKQDPLPLPEDWMLTFELDEKDIMATILRLSELLDMGAITQQEFNQKKQELLMKL